ncbi:hypothetical protein BFW01_g5142 [Lasiodiplodia theobromae]|nr:hypothetical protein BFW01_g5142 [Lasiodiplodia theobromae]
MRMRQLATTQSVVFFAPPEVHRSILDHRGKRDGEHLDSRDVVQWLLEQTCRGIEQLQPLYRSQGIDFCRRSEISIQFPDYLGNEEQQAPFISAIQQVEDHTLQKMYEPKRCETTPQVLERPSHDLAAFLAKLRRHAYDSNSQPSTAFQEVEQEREVAHEVEAVRKVSKPILYKALPYGGLHKDILSFERTGKPKSASDAYGPLSIAIQRTQTGQKYGAAVAMFHHQFLASKEFFRTVKLQRPDDNFLRPVTWVLWSPRTQTALMVTPEEAEDIISSKGSNKHAMTHLVAYAAPITRRMSHFNRLDYYAVPSTPVNYKMPQWLITHLGMFAGRLYFGFEEYEAITTFIQGNQQSDGRPGDQDLALPSIASNLIVFLQEWITVRRKGQEFTHTPMGYVCDGKLLSAQHPFFSTTNDVSAPTVSSGMLAEDVSQDTCISDSDSCDGSEDAFSGSETDVTEE